MVHFRNGELDKYYEFLWEWHEAIPPSLISPVVFEINNKNIEEIINKLISFLNSNEYGCHCFTHTPCYCHYPLSPAYTKFEIKIIEYDKKALKYRVMIDPWVNRNKEHLVRTDYWANILGDNLRITKVHPYVFEEKEMFEEAIMEIEKFFKKSVNRKHIQRIW